MNKMVSIIELIKECEENFKRGKDLEIKLINDNQIPDELKQKLLQINRGFQKADQGILELLKEELNKNG